jgi:hypothetical protein
MATVFMVFYIRAACRVIPAARRTIAGIHDANLESIEVRHYGLTVD